MPTNLNYSHLGRRDEAQILYNNIWASQITTAKRKQIKFGMDDFTGFSWRGVDAFENFGAFIINNKNSLKFYGGSTYSNQYTKPQFESSTGNLTGVSFNTPKIDFTIGAWWISEDDYRQLIYWLNPYEISALTFDFEPFYYYQVKLASVEQGIRYIVGTEKNYDIEANSDTEIINWTNNIEKIRVKILNDSEDGNFKQNRVYQLELKSNYEHICSTRNEVEFLYSQLVAVGSSTSFLYVGQNSFTINDILVQPNQSYKILKISYNPSAYRTSNISNKTITNYYLVGLANEKDYRYYTEFKVSFEVQGPACAYHKMGYEFDYTTEEEFPNQTLSGGIIQTWTVNSDNFHQIGNSNLEMPFVWRFPICLKNIFKDDLSLEDISSLELLGLIKYDNYQEKTLFNTNLTNLSFLVTPDVEDQRWVLDLKYDSNSGLMFLELGNNEHLLLSRLTTVSTGKRIVNDIDVKKHFLAGTFDSYLFNLSKIQLILKINAFKADGSEISLKPNIFTQNYEGFIDMRARTNLI